MKKVLKFIGTFMALGCSIFIFVIVISGILFNSNKKIISQKNIEAYLTKLNVLELPANVVFNFNDLEIEINEDDSLKEAITKLAKDDEFSNKIILEVIESEQFISLISQYFNEIITYVLFDTEKPSIDNQKLDDLAVIVYDIISKKETIDLNEYNQEKVKSILNEYKSKIDSISFKRQDILNNNRQLEITLNIYSRLNIGYFIGSVIVMMFLIGLFKWNWYKPLKYAGCSIIISGLLFLGLSFIRYFVNDLIIERFTNYQHIVNIFVVNISNVFQYQAIVLILTGLIMITTYLIINKRREKKRKIEETQRIDIEQINI